MAPLPLPPRASHLRDPTEPTACSHIPHPHHVLMPFPLAAYAPPSLSLPATTQRWLMEAERLAPVSPAASTAASSRNSTGYHTPAEPEVALHTRLGARALAQQLVTTVARRARRSRDSFPKATASFPKTSASFSPANPPITTATPPRACMAGSPTRAPATAPAPAQSRAGGGGSKTRRGSGGRDLL